MENKDKFKSAILGAMAGLVAGILLAPKAGKETRADIKETYNKLHKDLSKKFQETKEITKEKYSEVLDEVLGKYETNKEITKEEADEVRKNLDEGFQKIKDRIDKENK